MMMLLAPTSLALLVCGLALLLLALARIVRHRSRRYCPGPAGFLRRWVRGVLPWNGGCRYDLGALDSAGCRCPECGTPSKRSGWLRQNTRLRVGRIGMLLCVAGGVGVYQGMERLPWDWAEHLPSTPLLAIERVMGERAPYAVREEIERRVWARMLNDSQRRELARSLARDLRSDGVNGNAMRAMGMLATLGNEGIEVLLDALKSNDHQERQLAADVLREAEGFELNANLLRVCVEGLRDDRFPFDPGSALDTSTWTWCSNARGGTAFLVKYAIQASPHLARGLRSDDRQQRLLCAAIAGWGKLTDLAPQAGPILLVHLADNDMAGDAKIAYSALASFGPEVRAILEQAIDSPDTQQRQAAQSLLGRMGDNRFKGVRPTRLSENGVDPTRFDYNNATRDLR